MAAEWLGQLAQGSASGSQLSAGTSGGVWGCPGCIFHMPPYSSRYFLHFSDLHTASLALLTCSTDHMDLIFYLHLTTLQHKAPSQ